MKRSEAFPSKFLSKDDVHAPRVATIEDVQNQTIKGEGGEETKPVMYFRDFDKPMVLNNVNWMTIESEYGDESDQWKGKRIELYVDPNIMFGNKRIGGVRIRIPSASGAAQNGAWPWPVAVQKASEVGVDEAGLKAALKEIGLTSYNSARDTAAVKKFINDRHADSQFAGTGAEFKEDDIPF